MEVTVAGAGLAGCEAAYRLAELGIPVRLIEMKPLAFSAAHKSPGLAELVCSNSLRSSDLESGPGLLKEELRIMGSLIMEAADYSRVPAGKALAVDRNIFSDYVTEKISQNPLISLCREEVKELASPNGAPMIIATGPLTSDDLAADISRKLGGGLFFYDAIAPIVSAESLDMSKLFRASRYGEGEGDYLNAPMDEVTYRHFVEALMSAKKMDPHPFEKIPHFEGCLPVEELARRGPDTLAFGPMKPVGLTDPKTGFRPFAVVQLRSENKERTLYNLVGFQTKMTYPEQDRVFRIIPGLENAEFVRLGSVHRNTYIQAPEVLDEFSRAIALPHVFFAGQITGVEGYIESTASGLAVGMLCGMLSLGVTPELPPGTTAIGALLRHTRNRVPKKYDPSNINFGLIDPAPKGTPKRNRKQVVSQRALTDLVIWKEKLEKLLLSAR